MQLVIPGCIVSDTIDLTPYFEKHNITYATMIFELQIPKETIADWVVSNNILITDPYYEKLETLFPEIRKEYVIW